MLFTPGLQLQRQLNYAKYMVPDIVSNAQNRTLKKLSWIQILDTALLIFTRKYESTRKYVTLNVLFEFKHKVLTF